jgi:hypothetical protein
MHSTMTVTSVNQEPNLCHENTPVIDSHPYVGTSIANHTGITSIFDPATGQFPLTLELGSCDSKSRGQRRHFEITSSKTLRVFWLHDRHSIKTNQQCVGFLECTQFISTGIPRCGRKTTIAYSVNGEENAYHLGWVHSLVYADHVKSSDDVLNVYRWDGKVTLHQDGVRYPTMFDEPLDESWLSHVTFQTIIFSKKHPLDIVFLNQVCGKTPNNKDYGVNIINNIDGCIQSSNAGQDCLPFPFPPAVRTPQTMVGSTVNTVNTGHPPIFTRTRNGQRWRGGRKQRNKAHQTQTDRLNPVSTSSSMKDYSCMMNKRQEWKINE